MRAGQQQRRDRDDQDVVGQKSGEAAANHHGQRQQRFGAAGANDRAGAEVDKPRFGELRRDDHHREQQRDGRHVDSAAEIVERHLAAGQQPDYREQRDPGAIDTQPGDSPGRHADIGQDQDKEDDRGVHRGSIWHECSS